MSLPNFISVQGAKIITASHFDFEYVLGHKISFVCLARGSPRPHITWFKDGVELYSHNYLNVSKLHDKVAIISFFFC